MHSSYPVALNWVSSICAASWGH